MLLASRCQEQYSEVTSKWRPSQKKMKHHAYKAPLIGGAGRRHTYQKSYFDAEYEIYKERIMFCTLVWHLFTCFPRRGYDKENFKLPLPKMVIYKQMLLHWSDSENPSFCLCQGLCIELLYSTPNPSQKRLSPCTGRGTRGVLSHFYPTHLVLCPTIEAPQFFSPFALKSPSCTPPSATSLTQFLFPLLYAPYFSFHLRHLLKKQMWSYHPRTIHFK